VYAWEKFTGEAGKEKSELLTQPKDKAEKASLLVKEDCRVVAWVGANEYKVTYSVDGNGGRLQVKGNGGRPVNPQKNTPRDKWEHVDLTFKQQSPIDVRGGDHVSFIPKPDLRYAVDYFLITKGGETTKEYDLLRKGDNLVKEIDISGNCEVKAKFRDYYLLNYKVETAEETGTFAIKKLLRKGQTVDVAKLEKILKTDKDGKPMKDSNGKEIVLGLKVLHGDKITFEATPAKEHQVKEWSGEGRGYDPTKKPTAKTRTLVVSGDLEVKVSFEKVAENK